MLRGRTLFQLAALLVAGFAGTGLSAASPRTAAARSAEFADQLLGPHNAERSLVGLQPLTWDPALAEAAVDYAAELAATDKWEHSAAERRVGQGENLWMGTRGAFTRNYMVGEWLAERRWFKAGTFPNVTTSASWHDVGHYTQIIWPATAKVGCGVRSSAGFDYLVCRYSNPGNVVGERVGPVTVASN